MTQGFLFTDDDTQADPTDFAVRMRHAANADEGRGIIHAHEAAINAEERRLGLPPTVGKDGSGYYSRGFSTLRPNELKALARRSPRFAELVRQGKEMRVAWEPLLAASLAKLQSELCGNWSKNARRADAQPAADIDNAQDTDTDAADDAPNDDTDPDEWDGPACLDWRREGNRCTLDGQPARIIGRTAPYATIEPVDLEAEEIVCGWAVVAEVLEDRDGAFISTDAE